MVYKADLSAIEGADIADSMAALRDTIERRVNLFATRQSVTGVEIISPIGPHSHVQKMAATITDTGESPVEWPYSKGSTT